MSSENTPESSSLPFAPTRPWELSLLTVLPAEAAEPTWQEGELLLDEFIVEGLLGRGGMGAVYRVRRRTTGETLAVKRTRLRDREGRQRFLGELQAWIDLPDHPNLMPCRFFRTIDDEIVLFTDLAEGGSLHDRIVAGQTVDANQLLDLAIQMARGLDVLHRLGLVHMDVKPANVLLTNSGVARVTDFGLARARKLSGPLPEGTAVATHLVTGGAMTPAYCSPEQASGASVTRRTDIWSWAVTVLELFVGRSPCCTGGGARAAEALETHLNAIPPEVVELLRLCFRHDPAQRWNSLDDAALLLVDLYQQRTGAPYPRPAPVFRERSQVRSPTEGQTASGQRWDPPRRWLSRAFEAYGRDPTEVENALPALANSRKGRAVADLALFEEARRLFEQLLHEGYLDVRVDFARMRAQKALVHVALADLPGALCELEAASEIWRGLVDRGRRELAPELARTELHMARLDRSQGDYLQAIARCDRVRELFDRADNQRLRRELREEMASAAENRALAFRGLGRPQAALALFDEAIAIWETVVHEEKQSGPANDLARVYLAKAGALSALGRHKDALELCDESIRIRRRLIQLEGRDELRPDLARAYQNKAATVRAQLNAAGAIQLYEDAIELWERLVRREGRDDLAPDLARAILGKAHALRLLQRHADAAALCGEAAECFAGLIDREDRRELVPELARALLHQGNSLRAANRVEEAAPLCERALGLWRRLVEQEGRSERRADLARACAGLAAIQRQRGRLTEALDLLNEALAVRDETSGEEERGGEMGRERVSRGEVLLALGRREEARADFEASVQLLQPLIEGGRAELRGPLYRAQRGLRETAPPASCEQPTLEVPTD